MSKSGFCKVSVANLIKEPSHSAERHSQLLFGEQVEILSDNDQSYWAEISIPTIKERAWVLRSQIEETHQEIISSGIVYGNQGILNMQNDVMPTLSGMIINEVYNKNIHHAIITKAADNLKNDEFKFKILMSYLGAPYSWGGLTVFGIDCSGLSKIFYRFMGILLPHEATLQIDYGTSVDFLQNTQMGDLAFFVNESEMIHHVGIMLNEHQIIHASESNGVVAIDEIDIEGIIQHHSHKRTHKLKLIKRLI